ncbi:MAG: hypothetical protein HY514_04650 [Candidatus Aenigmarchaeota archaeon]|nr:hypothetical protein [Candidatus Aenigmarchaeota archaeon]
MNDLAKIRNRLLKEGFPDLLDEDISVKYARCKPYFDYDGSSKKGYRIRACLEMRRAPLQAVEGGLAHELCHIATEKFLGKKQRKQDVKLNKKSKRYRTLDERDTDLRVILRGYGRQLLALLQYAERKGDTYHKDDGLSAREVEKLLYGIPRS